MSLPSGWSYALTRNTADTSYIPAQRVLTITFSNAATGQSFSVTVRANYHETMSLDNVGLVALAWVAMQSYVTMQILGVPTDPGVSLP